MVDLPSRAGSTSAFELAIRCLDLTSLEGDETTQQVEELCARAIRPDPQDPSIPGVAAVVLYPAFIEMAAARLRGSGVHLASVAGFPRPVDELPKRLAEIHSALEFGADEIDIVLNLEAFTSGRTEQAAQEIARSKEACGSAPLKVILETGELRDAKAIHEAATLAMEAGADFVKSSTGKVGTGATPEAAVAMMRAVKDFHAKSGRAVGVKVSGGVRKAEQALEYMDLVEENLGPEWLTPERFRIGASSLLDELVRSLREGRER